MARRHATATHAPPKAASQRGLQAAIAALHEPAAPMDPDARAQAYHALAQTPYRRTQGDLKLVLPSGEGDDA